MVEKIDVGKRGQVNTREPIVLTRSALVLANSEAIQKQRMHKQICK